MENPGGDSVTTSPSYGDFAFVGCWVNISRMTSELQEYRDYCRSLYDNRDRITTYMAIDWSQIIPSTPADFDL